MRRRLTAALIAALLGGAAVWAWEGDSQAVAGLSQLPLSATALPLNPDDPAQDRIGGLRFLGALQLRSSNPLFGGISGLRAGPGQRLLAETDTGNWIAFDTVERDGRLVGVSAGIIAPILRPDGVPAVSKEDGDCEALEYDPATGDVTLSYEQDHRLVQFRGIDPARAETLTRKPVATERLAAAAGWRANGGGEALAILPGGARIVIREDGEGENHDALLTVNGATRALTVTAPLGFSPTDAVALDATRIVLVNRRFSPLQGVAAAVTIADLAPALAATEPVRIEARPVATWKPPLTVDNMEGLALRREGGRTVLYIASDDNLNSLQRTLLMKFELLPDAPSAAPATSPRK